ncbi:MAG: helix-turn-helix transcriptional regulator, partial [Gammaproteobacteria bacterium]|nr:helix-turn-helix transcriptional regulator [Gammaproteobacteria bacterium]
MGTRTHVVDPDNRRGAEAEARLRRMLSVAERMFVERGYAHTSLDAIVRRSGGSKATLLKYFRN